MHNLPDQKTRSSNNIDRTTTPSKSPRDLLTEVPAFRGLSTAVIDALARNSERVGFESGAMIFVQGEPVAGLFLVVDGVVRLSLLQTDGREHIIHLAQVGETFNDVAVLDGGANPVTALAQTDVSALRIGRDRLRLVADQYPELAWSLAASIAVRTRFMVGLVEDLAMRSVKGRLAHLLLEQAKVGESDTVPRLLTQDDMASQLGTVREMVSRVLRSLAAAGIIEFDRHRIVILDEDRLAEEAGR